MISLKAQRDKVKKVSAYAKATADKKGESQKSEWIRDKVEIRVQYPVGQTFLSDK